MFPVTQTPANTLTEATRPAGQRKDLPPLQAAPPESEESRFIRGYATFKPAQQVETFLDWMRASGVAQFDLAVIRFAKTPEGAFIPGSTKLDRAGVIKSVPWLRYENSRGAGIYIRPARGQAWPMLFLDDVKPEVANPLADTFSMALIETSPGRYHVWLATDRPMTERERYTAQAILAKEVGADPGSVSGEHWGRLPGFTNRKPGKEKVWVNLRRLSESATFIPTGTDGGVLFPEGARGLVAIPVAGTTHSERNDGADRDESAVEWKFVCTSLEMGLAPDWVQRKLLDHCAHRKGTDGLRYATLTVRKAIAKYGMEVSNGN